MSWKLEGTYFENCNCDMVCPCSTSSMTAPADHDRCQILIAFHLGRGEIEGTDVSGLSAAVIADTPPVMAQGNWRLGLLVDAKASKEQHDKLVAVMSGQKGGPMAAAGPLVGELLGVESVSIEYRDDGRQHSFKANGTDVAVEDWVGGFVKEPQKLVGVAHPVTTTLTIARGAERSHLRAFGIDVDLAGKSAFSAPFSWSG